MSGQDPPQAHNGPDPDAVMLWIVIYNSLQTIDQAQSLTRGWTTDQVNRALEGPNLDPGM